MTDPLSRPDLYRLAIENIRDLSIFTLDDAGRITDWNAGAEVMFGFPPEEVIGRRFDFMFVPEDRAADVPDRELKKAAETGRAEDDRWHLRKDGSRLYVSGLTLGLRDPSGRLIGFAKIGRDMTERQNLLEELERANRSKDEFLAVVSHELRTPLTAMLGWAQMLHVIGDDPDMKRKAIEAIERTAKTQAQLVDDLMDISRIVSGKLTVERSPIFCRRAIEKAVEAVRPMANDRGLRIAVDIDDTAGPVMADEVRLQQIVWNLLANAIKFTPKGGDVRVTLSRAGENAVLEVVDRGEGISAEFLPFMFDRFRQGTDPLNHSKPGLGLGLAIVKTLVEAHGGTVDAESPGIGHGATFRVVLPIQPVDVGEDQSATEFRMRSETLPSLDSIRVLVIDDQRETLSMIEAVLGHCGATVFTAISVTEAMRYLENGRPDVVISDIAMPDHDGFELAARVRAMEQERGWRPVPLIALTAFGRVEDRVKTYAAGYQTFLQKPVETIELTAAVANAAGRSEGDAV